MFDSRRGQCFCLFQPGCARIEMTARGRARVLHNPNITSAPWTLKLLRLFRHCLRYFHLAKAKIEMTPKGRGSKSSPLPISRTPPGPSSCLGYFDAVFGYFHLAEARIEMTARGARPVSSIITTSQTPPGPLSWLLWLIESLPIRTWQKPGLS